ncbi:MAG: NAD(P)H-binding protein [Nitrospirota bacterium]
MMRILVTGGTGALGRELVPKLLAGGHWVRVLSRHDPQQNPWPAAEWAQADLRADGGLTRAVWDVQVIVHAATSPFLFTNAVDVEGTRRLLGAARAAGVAHVLYVSIVGVDRIPFPYYRRKLRAEQLVRASGLPWSIARLTQFHALIDRVLAPLEWLPAALLPLDFQVQPIAPEDAARQICDGLAAGPAGLLPDTGGPEVHSIDAMARMWLHARRMRLHARRMRRLLLRLPVPGRAAEGFRRGLNTCPERRVGRITWAQWVRRRYAGDIG